MTAAQHHYGLVTEWLGSLCAEQDARNDWMFHVPEQVRRWRDEDRANGMPWADEEKQA